MFSPDITPGGGAENEEEKDPFFDDLPPMARAVDDLFGLEKLFQKHRTSDSEESEGRSPTPDIPSKK